MGKIQVKHGPLNHVEDYVGLNGELIWAEDSGQLFITDVNGNKHLIGGQGGVIVQTIQERNAIPQHMRQWRMIVGVYNDPNPFRNGQYELVYNLSDTNLLNNDNFRSLNKHIVHIVEQTSGVVEGGAHQLSTGVVPAMYARKDGEEKYRKIIVDYELNPQNGDLSWSTSQQVYEAYLVLI